MSNVATRFDQELARFDRSTVDLADTLDSLVKVLNEGVNQLRNEMLQARAGAAGERNATVTADYAKRVEIVVRALSAATTCQVSLDKTAEKRAKAMTPEARLEALRRATLRIPYPDRRVYLLGLLEAHNRQHAEGVALGVPTEPAVAILGIDGATKVWADVA